MSMLQIPWGRVLIFLAYFTCSRRQNSGTNLHLHINCRICLVSANSSNACTPLRYEYVIWRERALLCDQDFCGKAAACSYAADEVVPFCQLSYQYLSLFSQLHQSMVPQPNSTSSFAAKIHIIAVAYESMKLSGGKENPLHNFCRAALCCHLADYLASP